MLTRIVAWCVGLFHHFREPVMITEGKMQYLYDERGRRYLDVSAAEEQNSSTHRVAHALCWQCWPESCDAFLSP